MINSLILQFLITNYLDIVFLTIKEKENGKKEKPSPILPNSPILAHISMSKSTLS